MWERNENYKVSKKYVHNSLHTSTTSIKQYTTCKRGETRKKKKKMEYD